jgi:hypothetical protein
MKQFRVICCLGIMLCLMTILIGCDSDGDQTGPDKYFPANYQGAFRFDAVDYWFPMEFTIWDGGQTSGRIQGTDNQGNFYDYTFSGSLQGGELELSIAGEYGPPPCAVSGEITGTSSDTYRTFTGRWQYVTCWDITFNGSWEATRVGG